MNIHGKMRELGLKNSYVLEVYYDQYIPGNINMGEFIHILKTSKQELIEEMFKLESLIKYLEE